MEVDVENEIGKKILNRLQEHDQKEEQFPRFIEMYRELLSIQQEAKSSTKIKKPSLTKNLVRDRLYEGVPLLSIDDLHLDWDHLQIVFEQVAQWAAKDTEGSPGEIEVLRNIARNGSLLRESVSTWYQGRSLATIAAVQGVDVELFTSVVSAALKPFLSVYSRLLLPEVDMELWLRRYCPVCGGKPDFAFLDKERGARWLLCSRCDTEWVFQRLMCPYCGNQDQNSLKYFTDDQEVYLYRIYVCESCHRYIKAIDLRKTESEVLMPLERIMTLDMDRQAQEKGYMPGWPINME
ncbi:MAG: formate dehydrogenase accessory protein FdhE [Chloroflexota bacterium]|nr:formate dehydrogenase accessory protein FdhE [Chloroflexota bacterium]